jgi:DNA-binding CsgD family transcriptional regulator
MKKRNLCKLCSSPVRNNHFNTKYCSKCSLIRRKQPSGNLTQEQTELLYKFKGELSRKEIAKKIGCSIPNLQRYCRDRKISLATRHGSRKYLVNPSLRESVISYYEEHGLDATQKKFPEVRVRCIIENYTHAPRCAKWKDEQIVEVVKMAGLLSKNAQAKFFKRPRANAGSIYSVWTKRIDGDPRYIHGLPFCIAKKIVIDRTKFIKVRYKKLFLWVDLVGNLTNEVPDYFKKAIKTMAIFQKWLFNSSNPRADILSLIKKRSAKNER